MSNAAEMDRQGRPPWGSDRPGGGQGWDRDRPNFFASSWHPGWILLTVLAFVFWWPLGLALLFFTLWNRNMGCGHRWENKFERMQAKMERKMGAMRSRMGGGFGHPSSGNRAFDDYRTETLRRLEEEQTEFRDFLDRLRHAKDKAEFDQFMNERRGRPASPPPSDQPQG